MNRFDDHTYFDDSLGQMLRWSLRNDVSQSDLGPATWARIEARLHELDCRRVERRRLRHWMQSFGKARRSLGRASARLATTAGTFFGDLTRAAQPLRGIAVPADAVWASDPRINPRYASALRYHFTVQMVTAWPLMGQALTIV